MIFYITEQNFCSQCQYSEIQQNQWFHISRIQNLKYHYTQCQGKKTIVLEYFFWSLEAGATKALWIWIIQWRLILSAQETMLQAWGNHLIIDLLVLNIITSEIYLNSKIIMVPTILKVYSPTCSLVTRKNFQL